MESKWPKFLTLKRMVLIVLVLVVGVVLATYFLGGYKGINIKYNTKEFTLDGFTHYTEYEAKAKEEAEKIPYDEDDSLRDKVEKCNYKTQLQTVISEINKEIKRLENNGGDAAEIEGLKVLMDEAYAKELPDKQGYINEVLLGYGDTPLMSNGDYDFYLSKKWTTFKVVEKKTGNVWYSNPVDEESFTSSPTIKNQQKSLINVTYTAALGGTTTWDSYTYAISDTNLVGDEALTPNFQIKEVKDENGKITSVQVYYYFQQRGINYTFFPRNIAADKITTMENIDLDNEETFPTLMLTNKNSTIDGAWEAIGSIAGATMESGEELDDGTIWHTGKGAPDDEKGLVGSYYIDTDTNEIYVKATEEKRGSIIEVWKVINTESRTWKDYFNSNVTQNNLSDQLPVYEFAYVGEGAPSEEDGINDFYYLDTTTNQVYKKANGTLPYTHVLSAKEVTTWTTQYYNVELKEFSNNTFGIDYYRYGHTYENMTSIIRKRLYSYFYQKCLYTEDDLIADNNQFGVQTAMNKGEFSAAIEYSLTDKGLTATVLDESITELEEFPVVIIEILPYFTAAHYERDGYIVIPDGSGAILDYNNGKTGVVQYSKPVYSTDLSKMEEIKQSDTEDLMLSMFAMVNTNIPAKNEEEADSKSGLIVDAISGASQLRLNANISKINDSFNRTYFSAYYRESQKTIIGVGWSQTTYTKWTDARLHNDVTINYTFLEQDELDYSAIAKKYRSILVDRYDIETKDDTDQTVLNVSLVGAYDFRNNFLGIGYRDYDSMTTFNQAEEILKDLKTNGANHINAYYLGWRKKGLIDESFESVKLNSELGSKKDLNSLSTYSKDNDIDLYMDVNFGEVNKFQESYGRSRYGSRDVTGEYVEKYPYSLAEGVYDTKQRASYVVSPRYYQVFMENLVNEYRDDIGLTSLSFKNLGSVISCDYKRHNELFKEVGLQEAVKALDYASENGIENITLYSPYDFAFKYTQNALEVPYETTKYELLDYSIPFYQLVVNGLFDYSGQVVNANDEKGTAWHIMHILETGSNVSFTFSYEDSSKLIQTDYKYYYYTQYSKWGEDVKEILNVIDEIGIHSSELTHHERIQNNVYKVTYSGTNNIEIILNYSDSNIEIDGQTIKAKSYMYNKNNLGWEE